MNASKLTLSLALTTLFGMAGLAQAANPFALDNLSGGFQVAAADDKATAGKCGEGKSAAMEAKDGKCGAGKETKSGKCGEGKCGAGKAAMPKEGKHGDAKCGGMK